MAKPLEGDWKSTGSKLLRDTLKLQGCLGVVARDLRDVNYDGYALPASDVSGGGALHSP